MYLLIHRQRPPPVRSRVIYSIGRQGRFSLSCEIFAGKPPYDVKAASLAIDNISVQNNLVDSIAHSL